ncbi:YigZ family protein [Brevibacterium litoralis]|uniref:YigZ family protein n=1 Tax=Brevibacterium litoralis TaxID=3138935 RepID=UPI0032EC8199
MAYLTPRGDHTAEIEIKRSRFIARVAHVETEEQARAVVEEERSAHPKARHHCSAFVLDPDSRTQRSSDDGEPSGTAGIPMLEVLTGHGLTYAVAVVTRYFGGTLLGAGGLVRAYGGAVSAALDGMEVDERELLVPVTVDLDYSVAAGLTVTAEQRGWKVVDSEYGASVVHTIAVPPDDVEALVAVLADASAGAAEPAIGTATYH